MALLALAQLVSYLAVMRIDFARRLLAIVLSVALATGLVLHSAYASDMGAKTSDMQASDMKASAVMSSDMPMPGNCDGCGDDDKGVAPALCAAYCSTIVVLAIPTVTPLAVPAAILTWLPDLPLAGRGVAPDPYPPRPASLS